SNVIAKDISKEQADRELPILKSTELKVKPSRLDFGIVEEGKSFSKNALLTNERDEMLHWYIDFHPSLSVKQKLLSAPQGRYISFLLLSNNDTNNSSLALPSHIRNSLILNGSWTQKEGYLCSGAKNVSLEFVFNGTGISVYHQNSSNDNSLQFYLDGKKSEFITRGCDGKSCVIETTIENDLDNSEHKLTIVSPNACSTIEGIKIHKNTTMEAIYGAVRIAPLSGRIEENNVEQARVTINTKGLKNGIYSNFLFFNTGKGWESLEVSFEVCAKNRMETLAVFRYQKNENYFLTSNPLEEMRFIQGENYKADGGIAFNLFARETPGTIPLQRYYSATRASRYYCTENQKPLTGEYVHEGDVGNIATSRLTGTKPLYRWTNKKTGKHFLTTDIKAEGMKKRGYTFNGIIGFVK
ncbi:MAG: hypothetical protein WCJ49_04150, partial [Deltaproteobacteria bacterium]